MLMYNHNFGTAQPFIKSHNRILYKKKKFRRFHWLTGNQVTKFFYFRDTKARPRNIMSHDSEVSTDIRTL